MGWGSGTDGNGREVGYLVEAECDHLGCHEKTDRGLAFRCGPMGCETDDYTPGCGGFFCHSHPFLGANEWLCPACCEQWPARVVRIGDDMAEVRDRADHELAAVLAEA